MRTGNNGILFKGAESLLPLQVAVACGVFCREELLRSAVVAQTSVPGHNHVVIAVHRQSRWVGSVAIADLKYLSPQKATIVSGVLHEIVEASRRALVHD